MNAMSGHFRVSTVLATAAMLSLVTACGGGSDDDGSVVEAPVVFNGVPAAVETLPVADTGDSIGFEQAGTLKYRAYKQAAVRDVSALVTVTPPNGQIDFDGSIVASTANDWAVVNWTIGAAGASGALIYDGNIALACATNTYGAAEVFVSANMTPVASTAPLLGKTFAGRDCATTNYSLTYNNDGSLSVLYQGVTDEINAADSSQLFTASGLSDVDGSLYKARVFSIDVAGTTRYAVLSIGKDCNGSVCEDVVEVFFESTP